MAKIPFEILLNFNNVNYIYELCSHLTEDTVTLNYNDSRFKLFNPLNKKHRPLYLKTQFVPRSKHFSSRL